LTVRLRCDLRVVEHHVSEEFMIELVCAILLLWAIKCAAYYIDQKQKEAARKKRWLPQEYGRFYSNEGADKMFSSLS